MSFLVNRREFGTLLFGVPAMLPGQALPPGYNYDESKVGSYQLPDPLITESGKRVTSAKMWFDQRRPEILRLFQENVYGRSPGAPKNMRFRSKTLKGGLRKEVTVNFAADADSPSMTILIYLPKEAAEKPVPLFVGLNFRGNHTTQADPNITIAKNWIPDGPGVVNNRATDASRGTDAKSWPVETILGRGYGVATIYCGDLAPDHAGDFGEGVFPLFYRPGQTRPAADEWGAIGAWAWGLSRALDYFQTDSQVDARRVVAIGHSRLGKAALWAGTQDTRFAATVSNESGEGGAALSKRDFGETIKHLNDAFPHWFCANYRKFNDHADQLPVDQHELIASIAPRPVYVASAAGDLWSDPKGEFLGAKNADPVYRLLGTDGLGADTMPPLAHPILTTIGYHIRPGKHAITEYDWTQYLDWASMHPRG